MIIKKLFKIILKIFVVLFCALSLFLYISILTNNKINIVEEMIHKIIYLHTILFYD